MSPILGGLSIAASLFLSACDVDLGPQARQDFHYSYSLQPGGHLELENQNGSVEITGWDRDSIDVSGTKFAPNQSELSEINIKVEAHEKDVAIRTERPSSFMRNFRANYTIRVPRKIEITRAQTTNGSVTVADVEGGGRLRSTNGHVTLSRATGDYEVETTNGTVDVSDCTGTERIRTTNGSIHGSLKEGAVDAHSTNGSVSVTLSKPMPDRPLRLTTTNGGVKLELADFRGNSIDIETTHGPVSLRLPPDTNAKLSAHTSIARIVSDVPMSSVEDMSKHDLRARLGSGGPLISLRTSTGTIHVEKY